VTNLEYVARAICQEKCAFYGEPACHRLDEWDGTDCDPDLGCRVLAKAAIAALAGQLGGTP